jgi:hypothetical protein
MHIWKSQLNPIQRKKRILLGFLTRPDKCELKSREDFSTVHHFVGYEKGFEAIGLSDL